MLEEQEGDEDVWWMDFLERVVRNAVCVNLSHDSECRG